MTRLLLSAIAALAFVPAPRALPAQERGAGSLSAPPTGAGALGEAIAALPVSARVLLIGAHPDDEDNRLVAWLSRGRHADMAYLSLTRGDGGQNLIGPELGEALGVVRTEELLAARRVDGAAQYFARAADYGFSKSADEAFRHWPHDSILGDVVRVVRAFRPHVIISVFSGTTNDGHGQHQAAGILAREAYDAALDTVRFPRRPFGTAWTPLKFYRLRSYWGNTGATLRYDAGEVDPLVGRSYAEIGAISRAEHRSQAQGSLQPKGAVIGSLRREASRVNEGTAPESERSLFDGFDAGYSRLIGRLGCTGADAAVDTLVRAFADLRRATDLFNPSGSVEPLARIAELIERAEPRSAECHTSDTDVIASLATLRTRVSDALRVAAGVVALATVAREEAIVGRPLPVRVTVYNRGDAPVELLGVQASSANVGYFSASEQPVRIDPDSALVRDLDFSSRDVTQPYWLSAPRRGDMFAIMRATPATTELATVKLMLRVAGRGRFVVETPIAHRSADQVRGEINRPVAFVPAISVTTDQAVQYARAGAPLERVVNVRLRSADTLPREVRVSLALPRGLRADTAARTAMLPGYGTERTLRFTVRGTPSVGRHEVQVVAESNGERFTRGYQLVDYPHIRPQRIYRDAAFTLQAIDVALPPRATIAYIEGAADASAPALRQLGLDVTVLEPERLGTERLSRFTAIVVGPRAYESHPALVSQNGALLDYVRRGGTLVVQYGQQEMQRPGIMPFAIALERRADRVTDEASEVRITDPEASVLRWPNRITAADFAGWVQDRTLYMPRTHAAEYRAPLSTNDPGEPANDGALLVARHGEGVYVYTTLAFFRQLPAGVPGAARLFVNLLAAGAGGETPAAAGGNRR